MEDEGTGKLLSQCCLCTNIPHTSPWRFGLWSQYGSEKKENIAVSNVSSPWDTHLMPQDPPPTSSTAQSTHSALTHGPPSLQSLRNPPVVATSSISLSCSTCLTVEGGLCSSCLPYGDRVAWATVMPSEELPFQ